MDRRLASWAAGVVALVSACNSGLGVPPGGSDVDLAVAVPDAATAGPDLADPGPRDPCGVTGADPDCVEVHVGPADHPFPLHTDAPADPGERDSNLSLTDSGQLQMHAPLPAATYVWIANAADGAGTVSKVDAPKIREVARYPSVTCSSLKSGGTAACDGTRGCCALDDWPRWRARSQGVAEPPHQAVQRTDNRPSRTAIDSAGDLFVANEAPLGQSSVTRVAGDFSRCIDRNHNGRIDSSRDTNGDGYIQEDCNGDGVPDDLASVKSKPCTNKMAQEFYGQDDECVLWTSNTFETQGLGRALGLSPTPGDAAPSDVWAGSFAFGTFVRIDGALGLVTGEAQLPAECTTPSGPFGLAVDADGIGWVPEVGAAKLCFFDTGAPGQVGSVGDPAWGKASGYGVAVDRDQNVWIGGEVARYTPDRSKGLWGLSNGSWTRIEGLYGGTGIAADGRSPSAYFVWACVRHHVLMIPASTIATTSMDQNIADPGWPVIEMPCKAVGVDADQNVWANDATITTRALVDVRGKITQPNPGVPLGVNVCPAGDTCQSPGSTAYSTFTGFDSALGSSNGRYGLVIAGCTDSAGLPADTLWYQLSWKATVPAGTSLTVRARSGSAPSPSDPSWLANPFTPATSSPPVDLQSTLSPNVTPMSESTPANDAFLQVDILFQSVAPGLTPLLESLDVAYRCKSEG